MPRDLATICDHFGLAAHDKTDAGTAAAIQQALESADCESPTSMGEKWREATRHLKLYHGTSWESAKSIADVGFKVSEVGCLGRGVYVARRDKALRFAQEGRRHGGAHGGLVTAVVSFSHPKFVCDDDDKWSKQGYDACRTGSTSASTHMEWCLKDPAQLTVTEIEQVDIVSTGGEMAIESSLGGEVVRLGSSGQLASSATSIVHRWACSKCGAPNNLMWRPCSGCGEAKPLAAIGTALSLARHELEATHTSREVAARHTPARTAYRVGALGGFLTAIDDAQSGANHPAAFGQTSLMLPPAPPTTKVWLERTTAFNMHFDAVRNQMPPPPDRPKRRYFDAPTSEREGLPPKRRRDEDERSESQASTLYSTRHSRERRQQRDIARATIRTCVRQGTKHSCGDRWIFHDSASDITVVTDFTERYVMTAHRGKAYLKENHLPFRDDDDWFDLTAAYEEDAPPTPSARGSTPRDPSRSRSQSVSRDLSGADGFVGAHSGVAHGAGLGMIREYEPADADDLVERCKVHARVTNDLVIASDARSSGVIWRCDVCNIDSNIAGLRCIGCNAHTPPAMLNEIKASAKRALSQASDLGTAAKENPHRLGAMGGYVLGRYQAVAGEGLQQYPAAFREAATQGTLPLLPAREQCSLPDKRMLEITITQGQAAWPEEAGDEFGRMPRA